MRFSDNKRLFQSSICSILALTSACSSIPQIESPLSPNAGQSDDSQANHAPIAITSVNDKFPLQKHINSSQPVLVASVLTTPPPPQVDLQAAMEETAQKQINVDIWSLLRAKFRLPHRLDEKRVQQQINWFIRNPDYLERVIKRSEPFLYHIMESLSASKLPLEFALLPIVESAFDPFAYSHGRASGLWQFIPSTARLYGVKIDWWYDGRRDLIDSTAAANRFLADLCNYFDGDWELALAAYNSGMGNVGKAIKQNKKQRKPASFWDLKLPRETQAYVPKLLALSAIIKDPAHYNIELRSIANQPYLEVVAIESQLDLALAAELADVHIDEIYRLNAGHNQWATHPEGPHRLLLPVNKAKNFRQQLKQLPDSSRISWKRHTIKAGENLGSIAQRYALNVPTIKRTNNLNSDLIRTGDTLMIPSPSAEKYDMSKIGRADKRANYYSHQYGTKPIIYHTTEGDSLWSIAKQFNISIRALARWNSIGTTGVLAQGKEMKIFTPANTRQHPLSSAMLRKIHYKIREGDSLARIASKFRVSVDNIRNWNEGIRNRAYIHPGDKITIIVDVSAAP
jgi:membrane-bound lytic murein transglycosylase D